MLFFKFKMLNSKFKKGIYELKVNMRSSGITTIHNSAFAIIKGVVSGIPAGYRA